MFLIHKDLTQQKRPPGAAFFVVKFNINLGPELT